MAVCLNIEYIPSNIFSKTMQAKMAKYLVDCFGDYLLIDPLPQYPVIKLRSMYHNINFLIFKLKSGVKFLSNSDKHRNLQTTGVNCEISINTKIDKLTSFQNDFNLKGSNIEEIRVDLQNKLKYVLILKIYDVKIIFFFLSSFRELEQKNSSDYLVIQNLKNKIIFLKYFIVQVIICFSIHRTLEI